MVYEAMSCHCWRFGEAQDQPASRLGPLYSAGTRVYSAVMEREPKLTSTDSGTDRRGFLGRLAGVFGAFALCPDVIGQSLLVRSVGAPQSAPLWTRSISESFSATRSGTFRRNTHSWDDGGGWPIRTRWPIPPRPAPSPGVTYTFTGNGGGARTEASTYTISHTAYPSQTITVHETVTRSSPECGYTVTLEIGSGSNWTEYWSSTPSGTFTFEDATYRTATYYTTTWWPWEEGEGRGALIETQESQPVQVLEGLDLPHDILDARTRRGNGYRLLLGQE